jgi:hypothetical protein
VCLITAFRASRGWNASEVLLYTSSFDSSGEGQEARDSLVPNCYKVISIGCISAYLYVLYAGDVDWRVVITLYMHTCSLSGLIVFQIVESDASCYFSDILFILSLLLLC